MSQLVTKFIATDAVIDTKMKLSNAAYLRARNAANSADVNILRVNSSNVIEFASIPQAAGTPSAGNDLVNKTYADAIPGTGANTALSNLASVAINTSLLPTADVTQNLGSTTKGWAALFASQAKDASNVVSMNIYTRSLANSSGSSMLSWGSTFLDFNNKLASNIADPVSAQDAVTLNYLGTLASKAPVVAVSTTNITLSGAQTIDGVSVVATNRVLVAGQTTASQNGIYIANASTWTRSTDCNSSATCYAGIFMQVTGGTANADSIWEMTTDGAITIGTTSLAFSKQAPSTSVTVPINNKQIVTLSGTDITNQYYDLAQPMKASSLNLVVSGIVQIEGTDYTVSLTGGSGGVTRITFAGDLATGGNAALVSGDVVEFKYQY